MVEANTGLAQQVAESRTDLMDILPLEALNKPCDDLGLTLPFLAVYYDRPEMLTYLSKRGVDITAFCDPMSFGTPMYYAITLHKSSLIQHLDALGLSVKVPCDNMGTLPLTHAKRIDDQAAIKEILWCDGREERAKTLFLKNFWRARQRRRYIFMRKAIPLLQRVMRGMFARKLSQKKKAIRDTKLRREARATTRREKAAQDIDLESEDEDSIDGLDIEEAEEEVRAYVEAKRAARERLVAMEKARVKAAALEAERQRKLELAQEEALLKKSKKKGR